MSTYIRKNNVTHEQKEMPMLFPADRVYLDGDTDKNVQAAIDALAIPNEINTGITGVRAYKVGRLATLHITPGSISTQANSWTVLGALPNSLKPIDNYVAFNGYDNNATSLQTNTTQLRIYNGSLQVYAFSGQTSISPFATVTYVTNN